ncbi:LysR family transcriptional regulator [Demequina sp. NBRC 110051]|uniref:LysR family transcriptional regulator n=1 Tax=Demequina sp. NBRC 110051 TaxID=1570340 RepID=UPI00135646C3|nr:LysR family transcriptional regulator [Demequina sp. NBRC 110051]
MELRHLRYFAAVVETRSLTAAAESLHMTQPPLSVAIRKLEKELGVQLLDRTGRGVTPTAAGRTLVERAAQLLGDADQIAADLSHFAEGTAGTLTLAAVPALLWGPVPRLLAAHAAAAPEVEILVTDPPPWTAIDRLQSRKADVAAVLVADAARFTERHRGELTVTPWLEVPLVAVLPPTMADAPSPFPLENYAGRTLVLPRRTAAVASLPEAVDTTLGDHGIVPARIRTAETIQTSLPLIEAGLAWGILPAADADALSRFPVTVRPLTPHPAPLAALLLTRPGAERDPAVARLLATASAIRDDGVPGIRWISHDLRYDPGRLPRVSIPGYATPANRLNDEAIKEGTTWP